MSISLGKFLSAKAQKSSDVAEVAQVAGLAVAARVGKIAEDMIFYMSLYSICIQCTFVRKMEKSKMNLCFIGNWQNTKTLLWRKTFAALRIFLLKSVDKYIFLGYPLYKTSYYNQICNSQIPKR